MERKGVEPSTSALRTHEHAIASATQSRFTNAPSAVCTRVCTSDADGGSEPDAGNNRDVDLAHLMAEWPFLSSAIKTAIVTLVLKAAQAVVPIPTQSYQQKKPNEDRGWRKLSDIIPVRQEPPRVNDSAVDAVARSIQEFGFRQPIVVDEEGVIVVGHTRFKAAQKLGLAASARPGRGWSLARPGEGVPHRRQPNGHDRRLGF